MDGLIQDVRFAVRALARRPGYATIAVLTLALGIGLNVTVFAVVDQVLLTPLPFERQDELVRLYERRPRAGRERNSVAFPDFADWRSQNRVFESIAGWTGYPANLIGGDEPVRVTGVATTWEIFEVTGVHPVVGRGFSPADDRPGAAPVVVLSHGLWQRQFGGDDDVVGAGVTLDGTTSTVIGIMPDRGAFPAAADFWSPFARDPYAYGRGGHFLNVLARLRSDVTLEQARTDLDAIALRLESEHPDVNGGHYVALFPLAEEEIGAARAGLVFLMASVGLVLLIVCTNLGNMHVARTFGRRRELALRTAVGAARGRLLRQLVTESAVLTAAGAVVGVAVAFWGLGSLDLAALVQVPWVATPTPDLGVFGFTLGAAALTIVLTGVLPAMKATGADPAARLREGDTRGGTGSRGARLRNTLIAVEVGLTVLLLTGAGLTLRTFAGLSATDPGFAAAEILKADISLPSATHPEPADQTRFTSTVLERVRALPGVQGAAVTMVLPFSGGDMGRFFAVVDRAAPEEREDMNARLRVVTADFFGTMGIPILRGRTFGPDDRIDSPRVMLLNRSMAERFWPDGDALGSRVVTAFQGVDTFSVVGIVEDVRHSSLDTDPFPEMYLDGSQVPPTSFSLVVRADGDPLTLATAVRDAVREVDPNQPVADLASMGDLVRASLAEPRRLMLALALFAGFAVLIASVGIYGVVTHAVRQRTAEIGIRMALGARRRNVLRMVLGQGLLPVAIGLSGGLVAAAGLARTLRQLLHDVSPWDPATYLAVASIVAAVAMLALWVPARRATRVDPVRSLKGE